mgnify:CR=1 FL=1
MRSILEGTFKLDKGDIGSCPTDKKPAGGYPYSGRQEITHKLPIGHTIFETDITIDGAPSARSTLFQIHDGRNSGCLLYTSPSPRDRTRSRMPSSA